MSSYSYRSGGKSFNDATQQADISMLTDGQLATMVECARCHRKVPSTQTNITESGVLCDACT